MDYTRSAMNSKDLKPLFKWEERRVVIQDRIWYSPDHHVDTNFVFPGWESPELFGNHNPIHIEYCSGNGSWIVQKALDYPEVNWVAVEIQFKRVRKIWSKIKNRHIPNLVIMCGEGLRWTQTYVPSGSIAKVFVNFPDPWPKERHAKHRIISTPFALEMKRILKPGGEITMVTDDIPYSSIMIKTFNTLPDFISVHPEPFYCNQYADYGSSYFEELWKSKGREIRYHQFMPREI